MEYSPGCAIPYISRVDAGTVELVRECGVEVVSSGDLIQRFSAIWDADEIASHVSASEKLYRIKDQAFESVARRIRDRVPTTEYDIQQRWRAGFATRGSSPTPIPTSPRRPMPAIRTICPTAQVSRPIHGDDLVLLDLWGKLDQPARSTRISPGSVSPARRFPIATRAPSPQWQRHATRRRPGSGSRPARTGRPWLGSRSCGGDGAA